MYTVYSMSAIAKLQSRSNISAELANRLRDMIFDGVLADGERINEVHLAKKLGISRTPLREALSMLTREEALDNIPRRGFFVRPLSVQEFEDIYPIRALLDPEALRLSGIPDKRRISRLKDINRKIQAAVDMKNRLTLDDQWHLELLSNCQNQVLIDLIKLFMRRLRRYGLAFYREKRVIEDANKEHAQIIDALNQGDLGLACEALRQNLSSDPQPVFEWLDQR